MMKRSTISSLMDAAIIPGFSRIGCDVRSRLLKWEPVNSLRCAGRIVVITGPTSGLGLATVETLSATGAHLVLVGRNSEKCEAVAQSVRSAHPQISVDVVIAEMGNLASVAEASRLLREKYPRIDVLIHNAGALLNQREESTQQIEQTVASHVLGPFLMTSILRDSLRAANGRVITVSSGGMYAAAVPVPVNGNCPEVSPYDGSRQYALAKRMQVTLNEMWAVEDPAINFYAMHPGWADTPGVQQSIPLFRTLTKPILRTPTQGADTIAWLAAAPQISQSSGTFWCDREVRPLHKVPSTRKSDTLVAREALWKWCCDSVSDYL